MLLRILILSNINEFNQAIIDESMINNFMFQFRRYMMQPQRSKEALNIRICDTPGLSVNNISPTDLVYMLDGHLSDRFVIKSS